MLDFTSALYLGLRHPSWSLAPWDQLTTGRPAALLTAPSHLDVADALAGLVGCECATLGASTLHLFWDLFGMVDKRYAIYMDAGVYPIGRWGVERAAARGIFVQSFTHHDSEALRRALRHSDTRRLRPVVVADGVCPGSGQPAPIVAYLQVIQRRNGLLVLDDTQGLGILGQSPRAEMPLGGGGGGSLPFHNIAHPNVLLIASLAKAFGAPLATLAGSRAMVRVFEARSEARVHTSPPSLAAIRAAQRALAINRVHGDELRQRLAKLVLRFRRRLGRIGLQTSGESFPIQTLEPPVGIDAATLHRRLLRSGIRSVLHRARTGSKPKVSFLITADHAASDIDRAVAAVGHASGMPHINYTRSGESNERAI
jgi:8-amino-7-oxononanoate synthase